MRADKLSCRGPTAGFYNPAGNPDRVANSLKMTPDTGEVEGRSPADPGLRSKTDIALAGCVCATGASSAARRAANLCPGLGEHGYMQL
jgi:hypothetical protein